MVKKGLKLVLVTALLLVISIGTINFAVGLPPGGLPPGGPPGGVGPPSPEPGFYTITLLDESYDPVLDRHYFEYKVECLFSPGISHITFEMDGNCNPDVDDNVIVDAGWVSGIPLQSDSPEIIKTDHPQYPPAGIKYDFQPSIEPGQHSVIYFVLKGEWVPDGTIPVHIKAALGDVTLTAEGPDCTGKIIVKKVIDWGVGESEYMNGFPFQFTVDLNDEFFMSFELSDGEEKSFSFPVGNFWIGETDVGWNTIIQLYIDGEPMGENEQSMIRFNVEAGKTYKVVFVNMPPDFVIPETPWGVIGTMLTMLAAVALFSRRGLTIKL